MMLKLISDVHLEFISDIFEKDVFEHYLKTIFPHSHSNRKTVLIIAGDLCSAKKMSRILTFIEHASKLFKHVVYVLGNHEHYGGVIEETESDIRTCIMGNPLIADPSKITIAGNSLEAITIDDVRILAGTLWTDYHRNSPLAMIMSSKYMVDYRTIKSTSTAMKLDPKFFYRINQATIAKLEKALKDNPENLPTVVVTHHMPTMQAVDEQYKRDEESIILNGSFASDLDYIMHEEWAPKVWCFGHTHTPWTGTVGNTRLYCNPVGYPGEKNIEAGRFDPNLVFRV